MFPLLNNMPKYYLGQDIETNEAEIPEPYIVTDNVSTIPFVEREEIHALDFVQKWPAVENPPLEMRVSRQQADTVPQQPILSKKPTTWLQHRRTVVFGIARTSSKIAPLLQELAEHRKAGEFKTLLSRIKNIPPKWYTSSFVAELFCTYITCNAHTDDTKAIARSLAQDIGGDVEYEHVMKAFYSALDFNLSDEALMLAQRGVDLAKCHRKGRPLWFWLQGQLSHLQLSEILALLPINAYSGKLIVSLLEHCRVEEAISLFSRAELLPAVWKNQKICMLLLYVAIHAETRTAVEPLKNMIKTLVQQGTPVSSDLLATLQERYGFPFLEGVLQEIPVEHSHSKIILKYLVKNNHQGLAKQFYRNAQAQKAHWLTPQANAYYFCAAAEKNASDFAREVIAHMDLTYVHPNTSKTPVVYASEKKWVKEVLFMLQQGARFTDVRIVDCLGIDAVIGMVQAIPLKSTSPRICIQLFCDLETISLHHVAKLFCARIMQEGPCWVRDNEEAHTWLFSACAYFGYYEEATRLVHTMNVSLPVPMLNNYSPLACATIGKSFPLVKTLIQRFALLLGPDNAINLLFDHFALPEVEKLLMCVPQGSCEINSILNCLIDASKLSIAYTLLKQLPPRTTLVGFSRLDAMKLFFKAAHIRNKEIAHVLWPWMHGKARDQNGNSPLLWAVQLEFDTSIITKHITREDLCVTNALGISLFAMLLNRNIIPVDNPSFMQLLKFFNVTEVTLQSIKASGSSLEIYLHNFVNDTTQEVVLRQFLAFLLNRQEVLRAFFRTITKYERIYMVEKLTQCLGEAARASLINCAFQINPAHFEASEFSETTIALLPSSISMEDLVWICTRYAFGMQPKRALEIEKLAKGTHPVFTSCTRLEQFRYKELTSSLICASAGYLQEKLKEFEETYYPQSIEQIVTIDDTASALCATVQEFLLGCNAYANQGIEKLFSFAVQAYINIVQKKKLHIDHVFWNWLANKRLLLLEQVTERTPFEIEGQKVAYKVKGSAATPQQDFLRGYTPFYVYRELQCYLNLLKNEEVRTWIAAVPHEDWKVFWSHKVMAKMDAIWQMKQPECNERINAELQKLKIRPLTALAKASVMKKFSYQQLRKRVLCTFQLDDYFVNEAVAIGMGTKIMPNFYVQLSYLIEQGILL